MFGNLTTVLPELDLIAVIFFLSLWSGYTYLADTSAMQKKSITAAMDKQRQAWMKEALRRDLRMLDTGILQILVTGVGIFASTTIFVIGGLVAGMSYASELSAAFSDLPFVAGSTATLWAIKLGLLLMIFVYAFFKFAWSIRLANYCSILLGGIPKPEEADSEAAIKRAEAAATISSISGHHFNRGIRAYFFALAAVIWIFGPVLFIIASIIVIIILLRREFSSKALRTIKALSGPEKSD